MIKKYIVAVLVGVSLMAPWLVFAETTVFTPDQQKILDSIQAQILLIQSQINAFLQSTSSAAPATSLPATSTDTSGVIQQLRTQIATTEAQLQGLLQDQILDKLNQGQNLCLRLGDSSLESVCPRTTKNELRVSIGKARVISVDYRKKIFTAEIIQGLPAVVQRYGRKYEQKVFLGFEKRISLATSYPQAQFMVGFAELRPGDIFSVTGKYTLQTVSRSGIVFWDVEANAIYPDLLTPTTAPVDPAIQVNRIP